MTLPQPLIDEPDDDVIPPANAKIMDLVYAAMGSQSSGGFDTVDYGDVRDWAWQIEDVARAEFQKESGDADDFIIKDENTITLRFTDNELKQLDAIRSHDDTRQQLVLDIIGERLRRECQKDLPQAAPDAMIYALQLPNVIMEKCLIANGGETGLHDVIIALVSNWANSFANNKKQG